MIPLFDLNYDEKEINSIIDCLKSKWISMGLKVEELENTFSKLINRKQSVAENSCTAALYLAN